MFRLIGCLFLLLGMTGCSYIKMQDADDLTGMMYRNHQTDWKQKGYRVIGRVHQEYTKNCYVLGLFCNEDIHIYDDLLKQAQKMRADEVINIVVDENQTSLLWFPIFLSRRFVVNGIAVKIEEANP